MNKATKTKVMMTKLCYNKVINATVKMISANSTREVKHIYQF